MDSSGTKLRRLRDEEADYRLLTMWCRQESVYRYFEQRILSGEEIRRKYYPRTLDAAAVPVWMIEHEGIPVGIIQCRKISEEDAALYGVPSENGYEIDLFIGNEDCRGRGVGQAAVRLLSVMLFEEKKAGFLVMCPLKENIRAVRCYRKCGFSEKGSYTAPDTIGVLQEFICMVCDGRECR